MRIDNKTLIANNSKNKYQKAKRKSFHYKQRKGFLSFFLHESRQEFSNHEENETKNVSFKST